MGRCQRSGVERSIGKVGQLKRWMDVSSDRSHYGQDGEGGSDRIDAVLVGLKLGTEA